nr:tobamovirus multiplication protein 3-like [Tanacetum cinerariifolium]GFA87211.1 tobamovirus multiplication protein 3-like [Tanacetum cinerariifolium]
MFAKTFEKHTIYTKVLLGFVRGKNLLSDSFVVSNLVEACCFVNLHEVGYVITICFVCFLVRCIMMCFNASKKMRILI